MADPRNITMLLGAVARGEDGAESRLVSEVYDELRAQARRELARRPGRSALQATVLVNEVYLRLFGGDPPAWENRRRFFFAAARAMHDVVVEDARRRAAKKRGGDRQRIDVDLAELAERTESPDVLELDRAVTDLRAHDVRCADVVLLRVFGGLSHEQIAEAIGISEARARREWTYAKTWLRERLDGQKS